MSNAIAPRWKTAKRKAMNICKRLGMTVGIIVGLLIVGLIISFGISLLNLTGLIVLLVILLVVVGTFIFFQTKYL